MSQESHRKALATTSNWWRTVAEFAVFERDAWVAEHARAIEPGARVLDVGAGPCRYRPLFAHCRYETQDFCQYEGSEQGPFKDRGKWGYGKIDYVCDASRIPVPDADYDVVLCTEVLEHVPDPVAVVREMGRVLRPGGSLLLTAPLGSGLHQEPYHFYGGFTPYWYQRFLPECGFQDVVVTPNRGFFMHFAQEGQRFSALLDPRRVPRATLPLTTPLWLATLAVCRLGLPIACYFLDRLDGHRAFTVGYHVKATMRGR